MISWLEGTRVQVQEGGTLHGEKSGTLLPQVGLCVVYAGELGYRAVGAIFVAVTLVPPGPVRFRRWRYVLSGLTLILRRLQFRQALVTCLEAPIVELRSRRD